VRLTRPGWRARLGPRDSSKWKSRFKDVCLAFAGMQAVDAGYNVYGVVDASGALEVTIRENAVARMKDHGITPIIAAYYEVGPYPANRKHHRSV
jgi:hypothetical protein